ncbi:MAG TPA: hypothetical protein VKD67_03285, partial [Acidimicrobiales bacterium]|nr:hypothetical protein [Acidimicrobiales bacterium]
MERAPVEPRLDPERLGRRVLRGLRRIVPREHRDRFDRSTGIFYRTVGRYFAGSVWSPSSPV